MGGSDIHVNSGCRAGDTDFLDGLNAYGFVWANPEIDAHKWGRKLAALHFASVYFRILLNTADNEINKILNVRSSLGRLYSNGLC